jgi:hypothetical protein
MTAGLFVAWAAVMADKPHRRPPPRHGLPSFASRCAEWFAGGPAEWLDARPKKAEHPILNGFNHAVDDRQDQPAKETGTGHPSGPFPPPKTLPGFPKAKYSPPKTPRAGGGLRKRWRDDEGRIYEWDSRHGAVEVYSKRGRHLGEWHPVTGKQLKGANPNYKVES